MAVPPDFAIVLGRRKGYRVLTEEDLEEVVFLPAGLQALALDTHLQSRLWEICLRVAMFWGAFVLADPVLVFPEGDIQAPMQRVLDAPVSPHRCKLPVRRCLQAADVISGLHCGTDIRLPPALHFSPLNAARTSPRHCSDIPGRPGRQWTSTPAVRCVRAPC